MPDIAKTLKSFTASFAKWRYETVFLCMSGLLGVREIVQGWLHTPELIFKDFQDTTILKDVAYAAKWHELWAFMSAVYKWIVNPLEHSRRWGMVCKCCAYERSLGLKMHCPRSSRRLGEASDFVAELARSLRASAMDVTIVECEGFADLRSSLVFAMRRVADEVLLKFMFLDITPWIVVRACIPEVAQQVVQQLEGADDDKLDTLSLEYKRTLLPSLRIRAGGGEVAEDLSRETTALDNSPLDEGQGEGYHRRTNLEKKRATSETTESILAQTRAKQSILTCKRWIARGPKGAAVFRFEWRRFKRVLRPDKRRSGQPIRCTTKRFFRRLYCLDVPDVARGDWSQLMSSHRSDPLPKTSMQQCHEEYISTVLEPGSYYSVPKRTTEVDESGYEEERDVPQYFQVLSVYRPGSRPKLVPTWQDSDHVLKTTRLACSVLFLEKWMDRFDSISVYNVADPVYIGGLCIADFRDIHHHLLKWSCVDSDTPGCVDLVNPESCKPSMGVLEDNCSAIAILDELQLLGWNPVKKVAIHDIEGRSVDVREPFSRRSYFKCLIKLPEICGRLVSFSSVGPQAYFELLLAGESPEAGLGDKVYKRQLAILACPAVADDPPAAPMEALADIAFDFVDRTPICRLAISDRAVARSVAVGERVGRELAVVDTKLPTTPTSSSASSSDSTSSSSSVVFDVVGPKDTTRLTLDSGLRLRADVYTPHSKRQYRRIVATCFHNGHKCVKKRSFALNQQYGVLQPFAF